MERDDVQRWLDDYVEAWKSYDPDAIAALFAEDVAYHYHPYDEPVHGRDAVVAAWLGKGDQDVAGTPDEPGTYDASYAPVAIDGDVAVAVGTSTYTDPAVVYDNCYVIRFDAEGRCRELTEWFMERPQTDRRSQ
jgi:ketosteroid isomerase-like protein